MRPCFVFGSNLAGRHGRGAALFAREHYGARLGEGVGRTGNAYAIPTKDGDLRVLTLPCIHGYVKQFIQYATANPDMRFNVTRVGCGHAGYEDGQIAPLFAGAPENCQLPPGWRAIIKSTSIPRKKRVNET
jgi:hypothetical protein